MLLIRLIHLNNYKNGLKLLKNNSKKNRDCTGTYKEKWRKLMEKKKIKILTIFSKFYFLNVQLFIFNEQILQLKNDAEGAYSG